MARKTIQLVSGEKLYHVVSRGNNQQDIFFADRDYFRFLQDLFEFNDENAIVATYRHILSANRTGSDPVRLGVVVPEKQNRANRSKKRKLLVEILAFCLMPNHFHLLLRQVSDGGISLFMKKVKGGYVRVFPKSEAIGGKSQHPDEPVGEEGLPFSIFQRLTAVSR